MRLAIEPYVDADPACWRFGYHVVSNWLKKSTGMEDEEAKLMPKWNAQFPLWGFMFTISGFPSNKN